MPTSFAGMLPMQKEHLSHYSCRRSTSLTTHAEGAPLSLPTQKEHLSHYPCRRSTSLTTHAEGAPLSLPTQKEHLSHYPRRRSTSLTTHAERAPLSLPTQKGDLSLGMLRSPFSPLCLWVLESWCGRHVYSTSTRPTGPLHPRVVSENLVYHGREDMGLTFSIKREAQEPRKTTQELTPLHEGFFISSSSFALLRPDAAGQEGEAPSLQRDKVFWEMGTCEGFTASQASY
ncbi:uncharacterized protein LOC127667661 isoform X1 [Apodemus sylvaticus]|uniref:uncharacterized protein LOC127667661 isoform X1 n=1 Tax=Apodemus sylvaticus TaxID=10129 RepID=UPI002243EB7A|nr:uncharacterized protein LOC127667661 isoform X1 [Apodemus sylvaticus]